MQLFAERFHEAIKTIPDFSLLPTAPHTLVQIFALNSSSTSAQHGWLKLMTEKK